MEFGWPGDGGLGERLIQQIRDGTKTATCSPRVEYTEEELAAIFASRGDILNVVDTDGNLRCKVRMTAVYETTFGDPAQSLVRGEGYGDDAESFRRDHISVWAAGMEAAGYPLTDETVLVVEEFGMVEE